MSLDTTANPETGATATVENDAALDAVVKEVMSGQGMVEKTIEADQSSAAEVEVAGDEAVPSDATETEAEAEVTPEEQKAGYLRESDYRKKTMALSEERRAFEAERTKVNVELEQAQAKWLANSQAVEQMILQHDPILKEYNEAQKSGWAEFAEQNPGRAIALRAAVEEKIGKLQAMKAEREQLQTGELNKFVAAQQAILLDKMPDYRDAAKFKEAGQKLGAFLAGEGFGEDEIKGLVDHRHWIVADKARRWDEHVKAMKSVQGKKTETVVKVQKPGATTSKPASSISKSTLDKAKKAAVDAGDNAALAELLLAEDN